jgi:biopolymer transport protein ExbD
MKFYNKQRRQPVPVILPLIDILAILLIFFIVTTTFKKPVPQLQINLPEAATATEQPAPEREPALLSVTAEETLFLDGTEITLSALPAALRELQSETPPRALALQASQEASYGFIVRLLDVLREAGIRNIPALTAPSTAPPSDL